MTWLSKPPLGTQLDWSHPLNKSLGGFWLFNEGSGDKVFDISGNNNTGTLTTMSFPPTTTSGWNPGRTGHTIKFDGVSDYVTASAYNLDITTDNLTMSAWVNTSRSNVYQLIVAKGNSISRQYSMYLGSSGTLYMYVTINGVIDAGVTLSTTAQWATNKWTHIVLTYDHSNIKIFINGVQSYSGAYSANINSGSTPIRIGNDDNYPFLGYIDDVRIWYRALSSSEIQTLYTNPYGMFLD